MTWDAHTDARLLSLWAAGMPVLDIAEALGRTKGAVCGRAFRLGAQKRRECNRRGPRAARALPPPEPPPAPPEKVARNGVTLSSGDLGPIMPRQRKARTSYIGVELMCLEEHHCRYPHPDGSYCGEETLHRRPYCARHASICYERSAA